MTSKEDVDVPAWEDLRGSRGIEPSETPEYKDAVLSIKVGRLVQSLRNQLDLTQRELARRMGSTQPAIARLESGGSMPTLDTIDRLAKAAGCSFVFGFVPERDADLRGPLLVTTTGPDLTGRLMNVSAELHERSIDPHPRWGSSQSPRFPVPFWIGSDRFHVATDAQRQASAAIEQAQQVLSQTERSLAVAMDQLAASVTASERLVEFAPWIETGNEADAER